MMKKLLLTCCILLVLGIGAVWYFIPAKLSAGSASKINCNSEGAFRTIANDANWNSWAAAGMPAGTRYTITKKLLHGFEGLLMYDGINYPFNMLLVPVKTDSTIISVDLHLPNTNNLLQRLTHYQLALTLKKNIDQLMLNMQSHLADFEHVYGFQLTESTVTDTFFVSTASVSPLYPGTDVIYAMIEKLKKFCADQGCTVTGHPMLNISKTDSTVYQVRTALPVNRLMHPKGDVGAGKMVPGRFIITDVTGGPHAVEATLQKLKYYFQDYGRTSMAIPFSYLVTDRQREPDSSKWVTRIYAPVY